jgi:hypothetical protein
MNIDHQETRRMNPTMITMTPIMTPNTLDTLTTSFRKIHFRFEKLPNVSGEVKAYFNGVKPI